MEFRRIAKIVGSFAFVPTGLEWTKRVVDAIGIIHLPNDLLELAVRAAELPVLLSWGLFAVGGACLSFLLYDTLKPLKAAVAESALLTWLQWRLDRYMGPILVLGLGMAVFWAGVAWYAVRVSQKPNVSEYLPTKPVVKPRAVADKTKNEDDFSFEDRQFRIGARKFVLTDCYSLYQKIRIAISPPNVSGGQYVDPNLYHISSDYINSSNEFSLSWEDMLSYSNNNIENIDPGVLSDKIVRALVVYREAKLVAYLFSNTSLASHREPFEHWRDQNNATALAFDGLKATTSKYLKGLDPKLIFGMY